MDSMDISAEEQIERIQAKCSYLKTALHDLFQLVRETEVYWVDAIEKQNGIESVERARSSTPKAAPTYSANGKAGQAE